MACLLHSGETYITKVPKAGATFRGALGSLLRSLN